MISDFHEPSGPLFLPLFRLPFNSDWEGKLERMLPSVPWATPLKVVTTDGKSGMACRYCLAKYGLRASEVDDLAKDLSEFSNHMAHFHQRP